MESKPVVGLKNWKKKKKKCVWLAPGQQQLPIVFLFLLLLYPTGMSWMEDNHILGFSSLENVRVLRGINPIDSLPLLSIGI
jgi:hypothetical protein